MSELETLYRDTPPAERFGNSRLISAIKAAEAEAEREAERERRAKLGHLCRECEEHDGEWKVEAECPECDGTGTVLEDCDHPGVELPEEETEEALTPTA